MLLIIYYKDHFFTAVDLMQIALELDTQEKLVMSELGTSTDDFIKFAAEDSGNVALDGNFSIQVISKALETFTLNCDNIRNENMADAKNNPLKEAGFICNLENHWISIRKLDGSYWDLNSLHKKPVFLSELYLGAFLKQLELEGYSIFVVRGIFPQPFRNESDRNWIRAPTHGGQSTSTVNDFDDDIMRAIQESMKDVQPTQNDSMDVTYNENDPMSFDEELAFAMRLSMQTPNSEPVNVPPPPDDNYLEATKLIIRLPDSTKIDRKFKWSDKISDVFNWISLNVKNYQKSDYLIVSSKQITQSDGNKTLQECNLIENCIMHLSK